jgi:hypothetical protein
VYWRHRSQTGTKSSKLCSITITQSTLYWNQASIS